MQLSRQVLEKAEIHEFRTGFKMDNGTIDIIPAMNL